ncbi:hypothetical protein Tcan_02712 [Toxocara canis]|uniref:Uncharacterized protein n=1 Tax=Toxocara canis TaxID=6265 RepID=A0A0B2V8A3_TOXCA|nr:hypothetical protein Tcan_02712 [Toxocara canis]
MDRSGQIVQPYEGMDRVTAQATKGLHVRGIWVLAFFWGAIRLAPSKYVGTWNDLCWRITVKGAFGSTPPRYIKLRSSKSLCILYRVRDIAARLFDCLKNPTPKYSPSNQAVYNPFLTFFLKIFSSLKTTLPSGDKGVFRMDSGCTCVIVAIW